MTPRERLIEQATKRLIPFEFEGVEYLLRPLTQGELVSMPAGGRETMNKVFSLVVRDAGGGAVFTEEDCAAMPEADIFAVAGEAFRRCSPEPGKGASAKTPA